MFKTTISIMFLISFIFCFTPSNIITYKTDFTKDGAKETFTLTYLKENSEYYVSLIILNSKQKKLYENKYTISKRDMNTLLMITDYKTPDEIFSNYFDKHYFITSQTYVVNNEMLSNSIIDNNINIKQFDKIKTSIHNNKKLKTFYYMATHHEDFISIVYLKEYDKCFVFNTLNEF